MTRFGGRTAIVTGAAQGLGRAVAQRLLAEGANVVAADVQAAKLDAVRAGLDADAAERFANVPGDLALQAGAAAMADAALRAFGGIDVLVNVAGGSGTGEAVRDIEDVTEERWHEIFAINIHATYQCCRAVVPHMRRAGYGRIVNFSSGSTAGSTMWPTSQAVRLAYAAAKGAIEAFSRQLALDLAPAGITVNVIVPGFVLTEPGARAHDRFQALPAQLREQLLATSLLRTTPADIAEAAAFLTSEAAGHINGIQLRVGS
jgi:3-oxoacyl-[acyl-carrier protein] reductase